VLARIALLASPQKAPISTWSFSGSQTDFRCATLTVVEAELASQGYLEISVSGEEFSLDAVALEPVRSPRAQAPAQ
jgi:hypothetical protein